MSNTINNNIENSYLDFDGLVKYDKNIKLFVEEENLKLQLQINENDIEINNKVEEVKSQLNTELTNTKNSLNSFIEEEALNIQNIQNQINNNKQDVENGLNRLENKHDLSLAQIETILKEDVNTKVNKLTGELRTEFQLADTNIRNDLTSEIAIRENKNLIYDQEFSKVYSKIDSERAKLENSINAQIQQHSNLNSKVLNNEIILNNNSVKISGLESNINNTNNNIKNIESNIEDLTIGKVSYNGNNQTITGGLTIEGDLNVTGTTITKDAETSLIKDNLIVINSDGESLGTQLSGLSIKTDSENAYGIVYDIRNDSVSLGKGKISNGDFSFDINESKPILTRDISSNIKNGSMLIWDADRNIAVDGGIIDVEEIKKEFTPINVHNALVVEVSAINDETQAINNKIQNINNSILDINIKNESYDEKLINLEGHVNSRANPHNVTWAQINKDALSNISPIMNGVATIGTSNTVARADHIHPTDTSRAPITHIDEIASTIKFGHVKVDDALNELSVNPVQNKIITAKLNEEINRAKTEENSITLNLNSEIARAEKEEENLHSIINNLNYTTTTEVEGNIIDIAPGFTVKKIEQIKGKINVTTQLISVELSQVRGLNKKFTDIEDAYAYSDLTLRQDFQAGISNIETTMQANIKNIIDDIDSIKEDIENMGVNDGILGE